MIKRIINPINIKTPILYISKKERCIFNIRRNISISKSSAEKNRAYWILDKYDSVTPRNGKYNESLLKNKLIFEEQFFKL